MTSLPVQPHPRVVAFLWTAERGGAEVFTIALLKRLVRRGYSADVVFVNSGGPLSADLSDSGIAQSCLDLQHESSLWLHSALVMSKMKWRDPDCILLSAPGMMAAALRIGGYRGRIVAVEHGMLLAQPGIPVWRRMLHSLDRRVGVALSDTVVGVSDAVCSQIERLVPSRKLVRIYNGVDLERFRPMRDAGPAGPITFGAAGRLVPEKSFGLLIDAFAGLAATRDVVLRIAGQGPCLDQLRQQVNAWKIGHLVEFVGSVSDMPSFWNSVDVAVVPSSSASEAFGMVAAEASACGIPVVAAARGGLKEVVEDGVTGVLFEPGSRLELIRRMAAYTDRTRVATDGAAARRRAEALYGIDTAASQYARVLAGDLACE